MPLVTQPRPALGYGADYNPEQWSRDVWPEDVRLMREAGVTIVSLGIFAWSAIQPEPDRWDFAWLDEIMGLLHDGGIDVDLATATASPPPWLATLHPEILPVNAAGQTVWPGGRQHWRPTSPVFRQHALELVRAMATRYAGHPALVAWHISNELGCHNVHDHSDDAAQAFRAWLRDRYATVDALNDAWGTSFWSQRISDWDQVLPPRLAAAATNPTQQLDFKRFSSDALRSHLIAERDLLREITPDVPITTNFMVSGDISGMNYAQWVDAVDFVSNDHYVTPGPGGLAELSFSANLCSGLAEGRPWFLMEHSTSAVNWRDVNPPKPPGDLHRDALTHVAHGADAVCFFQWRQSRAGSERYHSAMVPHAGEDSVVFRNVVSLGATLRRLAPVAGSSRIPAKVGLVFDWESWWALQLDSQPSSRLSYRDEALHWYTALLDLGVRCDVLPLSAPWGDYDVLIAPLLHMVPAPTSERLREYVEGGGHLVTTYFSGVVDSNAHVWLGGYPGALSDLLGVRVEEFAPLQEGDTVAVDAGFTGTLWSEHVEVDAATEVLACYTTAELSGAPAVTRRRHGSGSATYTSTGPGVAGATWIMSKVLPLARVTSELPEHLRGRVELTVRGNLETAYGFLVNRTGGPLSVGPGLGTALAGAFTGDPVAPVLAPHGVVVVQLAPAST